MDTFIKPASIYVWIGVLLCLLSSATVEAGTTTLYPSGANAGDNAAYQNSASTDLDDNDSTNYGTSSGSSNDFYLDMDDSSSGGSIDSVRVSARLRCVNTCDGGWSADNPATFRIGVKTNGSSYFASSDSHSSTGYSLYNGSSYSTNPQSGSAWTWSEIDNLVAIVDHTNSTAIRVTELYVTINWTDNTAPAAVADLAAGNPQSTTIDLDWTAPGNDGSSGTADSYDIRYSTSTITAGNWSSATQVTGEPSPSIAGSSESMTVTGLSSSTTYYFAIKTADAIPNTSSISNIASATTAAPDVTAPATISDLAIGTVTTSSVGLTWHAPGDDASSGTATSYDIRYSTAAINDGNWGSATQVSGEPSPLSAGTLQSYTVTGLSNGTTYYFAIKTVDEASNWSGTSNSPNAITPSGTSVTLHPSGANASDNASYQSSAATDLDTNDSTYYGTSSGSSNDFYLDLDDSAVGGAIDDVRVSARLRCVNSCNGGWDGDDPATFRIGVKTNGSSYFAGSDSHSSTSYSLYNGSTYSTNPQSGSAWSWTEIDNLVGIVDHTNSTAMRVTELYAVVNYTPDSIAPAAVSDLATTNPTSTSVALTWTAPGDDGLMGTASSYDIRYSTSAINDGNWASATQASGEPTPSAAGSNQSFTVTGLSPGTTYYFAIKTSDNASNTSALSNSPSQATSAADPTAPAAISGLVAGSPGEASVLLSWTAPGDDDNTGTAASYDVRYSTSAINDGNWASATQATGEPAPQIAGSSEYFTVTGLNSSTTYYFAIKTSDEVPNTSALSNVHSATTSVSTGGVVTLHPSGANASDNASYSGSAASDLDSNDGNTSYGLSSGTGNDFYLDIDDSSQGGSIDDVRVSVVARCDPDCGGWGGTSSQFKIGVKTNGADYFDGGNTESDQTYSLHNGATYATNPDTGSAWTWSEIDALVGIVDHTAGDGLRVTEMYVEINYTPGDSTAPDAVSDLASGTLTDTSVQLSWTAPGDDGATGTATLYDIRYSTSPINDANWDFAAQATGEPAPAVAGSSESFTVTGLSPGTSYYFAVKTRDEIPNIAALSNVVNVTTYDPPVGGYTADNLIPAAQVSQSSSGDGVITINWKGRDNQSDNVTLNSFEYSVDGGSTWNAPTNGDASAALSSDWDDNGGSDWSTATTFASAPAHNFSFDTQHADVSGLDGVDQSDVQIRFTLNDGSMDSNSPVTSESVQVDNVAPTATITGASYSPASDTLTITGTDFTTIAAASTDIKSYVDWTKFVWDINGDDATTANISFVEGDVTSLTVTDATTLTLVFTGAKGTAIEGTSGYGSAGGADTLDVSVGFIKDAVGNTASTDAVADGALTIAVPNIGVTKLSSVISDPISASNPKRIPGAVIEYMITVSNSGNASPDADTTIVSNSIDSNKIEFYYDGGVSFTDGATSSDLAIDTVSYSQTAAPGPYVYDYTPSPDGDGYDPNITSFEVTTSGTFAYGGSPSASFTLKYRVRVK
ncbi:hypothetical protein Tel_10955 [Candidatus Tenderia electrophaga]|jgi:hypothetical protein|uniref:Fibronectin type-III domain-containing protein n=1 Tax=Candidatus Tenderia electrophaga TaxID=1748243 RepID=A0A0S2TEK9_9GAMM|nr:hypothetical protein Tel_10955 [Candidatus Tenderia electrophaga]